MLALMAVCGSLFFALVLLTEMHNPYMHIEPQLGAANGDAPDPIRTESERVAAIPCDGLAGHNLVVHRLKKTYGTWCRPSVRAVDRASLVLDCGECIGIVGAEAAGKSSLLQMLTGATIINGGTAWVEAYNLHSDRRLMCRRIGYCPQSDGLIAAMTGRETLEMHCALRGIARRRDRRRSLAILAAEVGITAELDKPTRLCCNATKRKLSIAVALCGNPLVVYLDEPTNGLPASAKRALWSTLLKLRQMGKTVVLASRRLDVCQRPCTTLALMQAGELKRLGSAEELMDRYAGYALTVWLKEAEDSTKLETQSEKPARKRYEERSVRFDSHVM